MMSLKNAVRNVQVPVAEKQPTVSGPVSVCPTCRNLGVIKYAVPVGHQHFGKFFDCPSNCKVSQQRRTARYAKMQEYSGLPAELSFETLLSFDDAMLQGKMLAISAALQFAGNAGVVDISQAAQACGVDMSPKSRKWLVFAGDYGLGKTGISAAIAHKLIDSGKPCLWLRADDLIRRVQSRYSADSAPSADDVLRHLSDVDVLIVDECNLSDVTSDKRRIAESIIRYRHSRQYPTVITTNLDQSGFSAMWGQRTAQVVLESAHWIKLAGEPLRSYSSEIGGF